MTRVLIVDDSRTSRELLRAMLESDADISVVGEGVNGVEAVERVLELHPDIVIMDVHMPLSDGLEATKEIMMREPTPIIIVSSATRFQDIEISLSATQAGAMMMLAKPAGPMSPRFNEDRAELIAMTKALAQVKAVRRWSPGAAAPGAPRKRPVRLPKPGSFDLVAIAASTGGPPALRRVLLDLPPGFPAPIIIVQHIARDFTAGFAQWLGTSCALPVRVAQHRDELEPGRVYVAPDDHHLGVTADGMIELSSAPALNGFRPSADHMFSSAAVLGSRCAAVILSGMGADGARGLERAHAAGAFVIAQDEASSVVYGMAQEAVRRNAVDLILPINDIGRALNKMVIGTASDA